MTRSLKYYHRVLAAAFGALSIAAAATYPALAEEQAAKDGASDEAAKEGANEEEWKTIFDGTSLDGWKINESPESWKLEDGALVANGPRSHAFYVGDDEPFVNFEFKAEVMTKPGSNGGIFFHTEYQEEGWPAKGYESQVNITQGDPQKTGGLYNTVKVAKPPAKDNEYWTQHIIVEGNHVTVKINDETVVDYEQPADKEGLVKLSKGTFALQAHDPGSTIYYKNIRVKRLP